MFFLRRTQPLALGVGQLRGLRLSLNTPVVATSDLPVGPARAAILVHQEPKRGLGLTVGVRSLGCGSVALYGLEGAISPEAAGEGIDAALAFAEGMGFLFDDELIDETPESRKKALARWKDAIGDGDESAPPVATEPEASPELFELDGSDLTDPPVMAELSPDREALDPPAVGPETVSPDARPRVEALAFEPAPETTPSPPLTKFRPRADTPKKPDVPAAEGAAERPPAERRRPKRQALGRLRLERRRVPEVQDVRRGWLLRLLTSF
ncbi:MAG: hypothetical protein ABFS41_02505 [Myxococcota bacterium]